MNAPVVKKRTRADKLLVVGHPLSDLEFVLEVMKECDISHAHHLEKEGIEAQEISHILLKAHGINHMNEVSEQISVSQVWNGLAMDLMMSNIDHSRWLWADSNALPLLNYWKSLDKNLAFVLVYNSPQKVVEKLLENAELSAANEIEEIFGQWQSYNRMLLNFYYRNQDRAILVNSQQVQNNSKKYLQEVGKQIGLKHEEISSSLVEIQTLEENSSSDDSLSGYLAQQLVDTNEEAKLLYLELESVSNLPLISDSDTKKPSVYQALTSYIHEQQNTRSVSQELDDVKEKYVASYIQQESFKNRLEQTEQKAEALHEENELQLSQLMNVQEELEKIYFEKIELNEKLKKAEVLHEEDKLQLTQLMQVEEELEKTHHDKNRVQEKLNRVEENYNSTKNQHQESLRQLEQLESRLAKEIHKFEKLHQEKTDHHSEKRKELEEENRLLLEQLHIVQEELEKFYLQNKELKEKSDTIKSKQKKRHYGAAERIKQQLSYRLGALMIENSTSFGGILALPSTLYGEVKRFRAEKASRKEKLPPLHTYADAYDAERVKKHLSYRLGQAMIHSMQSPLGIVILPFALKRAHAEYKKERK